MTAVALVGFATLIGVFTAWALGANSNSPPFAPAIGANAISTMRAAFLIGLLAGAGALLQGGSISKTVGTGLTQGVAITPLAATAGLLVAGSFMAVGIFSGYPVPAAFATTGAMIGVGLSLGGTPNVGTLRRIAVFWILVPPVSGGLAYTTATLLRRDDIADTVSIPVLAGIVAAVLANIELGVIPGPPGSSQHSVASFVSWVVSTPAIGGLDLAGAVTTVAFGIVGFAFIRRRTRQSVDRGVSTFLVILGSVVAFSSGGSQVGLATGPLEHLYSVQLGLPGIVLLAVGAIGILAGAWMGSPRLLQATAREYAQLGSRRSIAALVPGFLIAQAAIGFGIPISFNNIIISGVIGGGLAAGSAGVSRRKIGVTVGFWLLTLVASVVAGYGANAALHAIFGA
ncbi:MAG: anion permease [Halodesulfurarchaeum sp.]